MTRIKKPEHSNEKASLPVDDLTVSVAVQVNSKYIEEQSLPELDRYVFSYTVRIRNLGQASARLMTRHWIITDANGKTEEVRGEGVVGKQPRLGPGEEFEYTSGAILETQVGTMKGSYQMVSEEGIEFLADIPQFTLSVPRVLH